MQEVIHAAVHVPFRHEMVDVQGNVHTSKSAAQDRAYQGPEMYGSLHMNYARALALLLPYSLSAPAKLQIAA